MASPYNQPVFKEYRRRLRINMTDAERKLWSVLRGSRSPRKWRRQCSIGGYIVDFYCSGVRLVIEVDGGQHLEQKEYDDERTKYLNQLDIQVLRYWNNDVLSNIDGVFEHISSIVQKRIRKDTPPNPTPPNPSQPSPSKGRVI